MKKVAHVLQKSSFDTLWEFLVSKKSLPEIYKDVYDKFPGHPYVGIFSGSKPTLLVRDPEVIQQIFAGDFQSFHSRGIGLNTDVDLLADNLLFMDHFEKWRLLAKISPIFTSARLKNMFDIIERSAKDCTSRREESFVCEGTLRIDFDNCTTLQDTEQPSPQLTPARRSSKWDAAERHQSSRRPPHEPGCQDPGRSS
ncbi:Cytochrome P450 6B5 [Eumeta japonica]|uniref:unspecific monooxygenase n=1 Tax=Eumeta variegata TaxID=151549 RepID=A0A4C1XVT3_EUMVA|nr:Cytochrome P450 6B5 [Eumeta japonica]